MRVLAVGAHPDDLEILCGGTLARFVAEGHDVDDVQRDAREPRQLRAHLGRRSPRSASQRRAGAAEIAGPTHATLGISDGEVNAADPAQRRAVVDLVRDVRPDLIITHAPNDYMADHNEVSRLVFDCSFHATLPLLETEQAAPRRGGRRLLHGHA